MSRIGDAVKLQNGDTPVSLDDNPFSDGECIEGTDLRHCRTPYLRWLDLSTSTVLKGTMTIPTETDQNEKAPRTILGAFHV